jgi:hypothetical protein
MRCLHPVAVHEAGHLLAAIAFGFAAHGARILREGEGCGAYHGFKNADGSLPHLQIALIEAAGLEAERELIAEPPPARAANDNGRIERAATLAGADPATVRQAARKLVRKHRDAIVAVSRELESRHRIDGATVHRLAGIPRPDVPQHPDYTGPRMRRASLELRERVIGEQHLTLEDAAAADAAASAARDRAEMEKLRRWAADFNHGQNPANKKRPGRKPKGTP